MVALPQPTVDAKWLAAHLDDVRVVDVRWYLDGRSGRDAFEAGHVPGAAWADLDGQLSARASVADGRHPFPSPDRFAEAMGQLGIGDETPVVAYDDSGGMVAARLWWMLRVLDHPVAVLEGGLRAWTGPTERGPSHVAPAKFTPRPFPPSRIVDADEVAHTDALVLDARSAARFAEGDPAIDPRPGHIPGARNAPWADNLAGGSLLASSALRDRYTTLGADRSARIVCYCGSGVSACLDLLALDLAGYGDRTALYPGSWSQWGADAGRPAETGPDRGPR